jgi:hypothetical protein
VKTSAAKDRDGDRYAAGVARVSCWLTAEERRGLGVLAAIDGVKPGEIVSKLVRVALQGRAREAFGEMTRDEFMVFVGKYSVDGVLRQAPTDELMRAFAFVTRPGRGGMR